MTSATGRVRTRPRPWERLKKSQSPPLPLETFAHVRAHKSQGLQKSVQRCSSGQHRTPSLAMASLAFRSNVAGTSGLSAAPAARTTVARAPLQVEARVHIRFSRFGRRKAPVYRIIAIDSRKRRDGRPLEWLGYYNPISKEVNLDAPNIKKWISTGAQPSESVTKLLKKAMVIDN